MHRAQAVAAAAAAASNWKHTVIRAEKPAQKHCCACDLSFVLIHVGLPLRCLEATDSISQFVERENRCRHAALKRATDMNIEPAPIVLVRMTSSDFT